MLVVIDCPSDPIPAGSKVFDIATLVTNEKRVGLKNLHVIDVAPGAMHWTGFQFAGSADIAHTIQISPITAKGWKLALLFPKNTKFGMTGLKTSKPTASMLKALNAEAADNVKQFDTTTLYSLQDTTTGASLSNVKFPKGILRAMLLVTPPAQAGRSATFSIVQMNKDTVEGGSTFVLRSRK